MMADSTDDPLWTIFGVKLKPSAIAENIAASLVIGLAGFILLDFFTAFSNQLAGIMPTPGSATANVIDFTKIAIAVMFAGAFAYHLNRLGLSAANDAALSALRTRLTVGETAGAWYARTVRSAIFLTDRFFGDAGKARESWRPNAFGLKKAAPLWTAASYDRCLLIALVYPVLCIYAVWAMTGEAGSAGIVLGLVKTPGLPHSDSLILLTMLIIYIWLIGRNGFNISLVILGFVAVIPSAFVIMTLGSQAFIFAIAFFGIFSFSKNGFVALIYILSFSIYYFSPDILIKLVAYVFEFQTSDVIAYKYYYQPVVSTIFVCIILSFFSTKIVQYFIRRTKLEKLSRLYRFIFIFSFIGCFLLSLLGATSSVGLDLVYFISLLALVNAPFDWFALGVSRGLLRKGLENGGLRPLAFGLIDLLISLVTVASLGIAVLIVTQIFNATSALGGAEKAVFDPLPALRDLATPGLRNQPQYYWLYLMLLTTQIPAILNLGAGFLSVIRTGDFGNMWVLRLMGDGQGVGLWTRGALAAVQAGQFALAMTAGGLLFYLLFIGFVTVEPFAAGNLIDLLLWIAEANWPARLLGVAG
jgi:hypothetical protein